MKRIIHWFRRDLRISDNKSLDAACRDGDEVIPVYILSSWKRHHPWTGANRQEFLCGCLTSLAKNLEEIGGRLILRSGSPVKELIELAKETQADAIYFNRDPDPFGRAMEEKVGSVARKLGIRIHACKDIALHERDEILTAGETPFKVFTPYAKAWLKLEKSAPSRALARISTPPHLESEPLPTLPTWGLASDATIIEPGEAPADAVVREVREETGLVVRPRAIAGVFGGREFRYVYPNGDQVEFTIVVYRCEAIGTSNEPLDP